MNSFSAEAWLAHMAEIREKDRVINYVRSLDLTTENFDFEQMAYELNIENPILRDMLEILVEVRFKRMEFELMAKKKLRRVKRNVDKFQSCKNKMEFRVARAMEEAKAREEAKALEEEK